MPSTIRRTFAPACLVVASAGCAMLAGGDVKPLTPAERQATQQEYGEEVAKDVDTVLATTPRTAPIFEGCIQPYLSAISGQKEGGPRQAYGYWLHCEMDCRKAAKGGPFPELAAKYGALCKQGFAGASSEESLHTVRTTMETLRGSKKPDEWRKNFLAAEDAIQDARGKLGMDNPDLKTFVEEYDTLMAAHRRDVERAAGFFRRADIAQMRDEMGRLKLEIDSLGNKRRTDGGQALMLVKQRRYDELKEKIDQEARKAGIR